MEGLPIGPVAETPILDAHLPATTKPAKEDKADDYGGQIVEG